ncbi:Coagulation factor 5/8 type domain protein [Candidatus Sulfotelmatobacter kueseliae]|uniref:alpha-L-fucosidase n=1 Tax=Candidatus Sulfotelmatobacter kueseliae TaxID=2042962 RepID=A0A2U3LD64_9BACT|nr:Coagulation factor 5/8 type domain protein [Candidatus Sulfotelmatobacter kueseliae]
MQTSAEDATLSGMPRLRQVCTGLFLLLVALRPAYAQNAVDLKPSPQQVEWQDLEMGAIIHFGPNTFLDREWGDGTADPKVFNPTQFDPEQWMQALQSAGIRYVIFVAKHHDGFCLWPTEQTDYSVKSSPWENGKGDVVRRVEEAARKYGLKFGVYLSPWDRHEPRYKNSAEYDKYYSAELDELAQGYGDLEEFWLDGAGSEGHVYNFPRIIEELRTYQPNTLVFADMALFEYGDIRWVGNEDGIIPYENWNVIDRHGYLRWRPVEADTPLRKNHWFWHPNDEASLKSVPELLSTYEQTVGRGGQLVLGIAPDRRGLLPEADVQRLKEFGAALRQRYGNNLALRHITTTPDAELAFDGNPDTFWSAPTGSHHAVLEAGFDRPVTFNHTLVMEWLNAGQHVQKYAIEIYKGREWIAVAKGSAIGHKKIDHFARVTASRVRLNIVWSSAEAHIREFQIFDSSAAP